MRKFNLDVVIDYLKFADLCSEYAFCEYTTSPVSQNTQLQIVHFSKLTYEDVIAILAIFTEAHYVDEFTITIEPDDSTEDEN